MKTITFEVMNDDGSISLETTNVMEMPKFNTFEEFSSWLSTAFSNNNTLPPAPEVVVLI